MRTIKDIDVENKKVIVRVDYNVPIENNIIQDNNRIVASLKTINYLLERNAKIILLSHLGKVKTEEDKFKNTLLPVSKELSNLINKEVLFCDETRGQKLENMVSNLKQGDILLVENTRFEDVPNELESKCDEELSKYWASLGEVFILDAFGSAHRSHASTYGISKYLPHAVGFLIEEEVNILNEIINSDKNIILGGAKVEDKLSLIENLIDKTNYILIGGAMSYTFLKSKGYNVGLSIIDEEKINLVSQLLDKYPNKIILPVDAVTDRGIKNIDEINDQETCYDIGPKTIELFEQNLKNSPLVVWNGPLGKFEDEAYSIGTKTILKYLENNNIKTVIGGGDTGSAAKKYNCKFYHISTGGGATLEYLSGKEFDTLKIMED